LLAWLGADVVKVEPPGIGDPGRALTFGANSTQYFLNYNSNKRSTVINVATPRGRELLLELAPHYDVFVENYGPGVIEKLDIGYEVLRERNPSIIYGRIKGFGLSGPHAGYLVYDSVAQAAGGVYSVNGAPDGPPMRPGGNIGDSGTGVQMALAIAAAYVRKLRTGQGEFIEISMQEAVTLFMRSVGLDVWGTAPAVRRGNRTRPPSDTYPCAPGGPNDYIHLMTATSRMWDALCVAIDRADLTVDPRFATAGARARNGDALFEEIARWTRARTKYEAWQTLAEAGVPCSAVLDTLDLWNDPHLRSRDFIQTVEHPTLGSVRLMRFPTRMSGAVPPIAAPLLGAHTDEVLRADLGLGEAELSAFRASGVVA
jgi:formyl-CoA transferase